MLPYCGQWYTGFMRAVTITQTARNLKGESVSSQSCLKAKPAKTAPALPPAPTSAETTASCSG